MFLGKPVRGWRVPFPSSVSLGGALLWFERISKKQRLALLLGGL